MSCRRDEHGSCRVSFDGDVPMRGVGWTDGCDVATGSCEGRAGFFDDGAAQPASARVAAKHIQSTAAGRKIGYSLSFGGAGLKILASFWSFETAGCDVAPRSRPRKCSWNAPG